jgi:S1-C subfamily serine protease
VTAGGAAATVLTTSQIVAKTNPGIVDVVSALGYQQATASGTGIVLTPSGLVLTNNHVIDGATSVKVREVSNGRVYPATVVGYDAAHDIAVLQLKLVNTHGLVIGIDTAASAGSGSQLSSSTVTQAFTIPINEAVTIARQIEASQSSATVHIGSTAFLGIAIAGSPGGAQGIPASTGAEVAGAEPGSAAANAGLTAGDTITALGGQSITSPAGIRSVLTGHHPGDSITITWTDQDAASHSATVVLTTGPAG